MGILSANHYRLMKVVEVELAGVCAKERRSKQFVPNELQADQLLITPTESLLNPSGSHNAAIVLYQQGVVVPLHFHRRDNSFRKSKNKTKIQNLVEKK